MKRILGVLLVLTMLLALTVLPVQAQEIQTPWNNDTIKVNVYGTFAGLADEEITIVKDGDTYTSAYVNYSNPASTTDFEFAIQDEQFVLTKNANGEWIDQLQFKNILPANVAATGIEGFGMYLKNETAADITFEPIIWSKYYQPEADEVSGYLVDKATKEMTEITTIYRCFPIPAGFEGYLVIDISVYTSQEGWGDKQDLDETSDLGGLYGFKVGGVTIAKGDPGFIIDNLFFYGANVTEANKDLLDFNAPIEQPTDEPSDEPTEEPSETADVSTIAYALAAVVGCGALVIRKKK